MYETVIWVSLITATLGLIMEAIYRKTWAALAGSGIKPPRLDTYAEPVWRYWQAHLR